MKTIAAFATWNNRIAPVFDVSENVVILEVEDGRIVRETRLGLDRAQPENKVRTLIDSGAEVLVCGAISRYLHDRIALAGVEVIPFIAGDLAKVIAAWIRGDLGRPVFAMPGCRAGRWKGRGFGRMSFMEVGNMPGGRGQGRGAGMGRGMGRGMGGGMGRGGGLMAAGPGGLCVCPKCGHSEPHKVGLRCYERNCPKCGSVMARK